jgi:hypothetical protein
VGGDFSAGSHFPREMAGDYFFGDYNKGFIRRAVINPYEHVSAVEEFATNVDSPVDIQFGPDGALYYLSINAGQLHRITFAASNQLPQARIAASVSGAMDAGPRAIGGDSAFVVAAVPVTVTLSAAPSSDPDGGGLTYSWLIGDQAMAGNPLTVTHTFTRPGRSLARLVATDAQGFDDVATKTIVALPQPAPGAITSPAPGDVLPTGRRVGLAAEPWTSAGPASTWTVIAYDGAISRTVPNADGSFVVPELGDDGRIEIGHHTRDREGRLTASDVITVYSAPRDGYIRNWWLVPGAPDRYLDFDALPGGEANFAAPDPSAGAVLLRSGPRKVDLAQGLDPDEHTAGYAFVWVDSPSDRPGLLGLLSDDGIKAWLNGELVWTHRVSRYVPDDDRDIDLPPIRLRRGLNALLIKVDQNIGEWALKARVLNPDGTIMPDITLHTYPSPSNTPLTLR